MSKLTADLFVEDAAHEAFVRHMLERLAHDEEVTLIIQTRSARGGHPRVLSELALYQRALVKGVSGMQTPDLLVVAIDANCSSFAKARAAIEQTIDDSLRDLTAIACPDPHVERWYLADPDSFDKVVGVRPQPGRKKCERDLYKKKLSEAILAAGQPSPLGGIEFAREIVAGMNLHRAGRSENSLRHFVQDAKALLRQVKAARG